MNIKRNTIALLVAASFSSGCAVTPNADKMSSETKKAATKSVDRVFKENKVTAKPGLNHIKNVRELPFTPVDTWDEDKGNFSINASGKISHVLNSVAKKTGYGTVIFVDSVDKQKDINVSLNNVSPEYAIKKLAYAAGFVAIVDEKARSITISDQAVYTFKLPSILFSQSTQTLSSTYTAGSGQGGGQQGGVPGGGGGAQGSNASGNSQFSVSGVSAGGGAGGLGGGAGLGGAGGTGFTEFVTSLVGKNAEISVNEDIGLITVRSNAVALERLRLTLNKMAEVASRRVVVQATFIEVSLGDVFEYGIDWQRILNNSSGSTSYGVSGGATINPANLSTNFQYTYNNITSIISALKTFTDVTVISQPQIETGNRTPTTFFDGLTVPYLGSIQAIQAQTSSSTSGTVNYADDGVRLSFIPDIISDDRVQFMLMPSLTNIGQERTFNLGGGSQLTDFIRSKKEALLTVDLKDNQTAILGGLRSTKSQGTKKGVPGLPKELAVGNSEEVTTREVILLLNAKVIPGQFQDTLFAESL